MIDGLIERVRGLTGPDRFVDLDIAIATGVLPAEVAKYGPHLRRIEARRVDPYTASLDAAVALVERALPDHPWHVFRDDPLANAMGFSTGGYVGQILGGPGHAWKIAHCEGPNPGIALILALLSALKAKEAQDGR